MPSEFAGDFTFGDVRAFGHDRAGCRGLLKNQSNCAKGVRHQLKDGRDCLASRGIDLQYPAERFGHTNFPGRQVGGHNVWAR